MKKINYIFGIIIVLIIIMLFSYFIMISNENAIKMMFMLIGCVVLVRLIITPIVMVMVQRHDKTKANKEKQTEGK